MKEEKDSKSEQEIMKMKTKKESKKEKKERRKEKEIVTEGRQYA